MNLFSLELGRAAYWADLGIYLAAVLALAVTTLLICPAGQSLECLGLVVLGLAGWSLAEYGLHRFVLHGVAPFSEWHARHHLRPTAYVGAPTVLSAALIVGLVFAPAYVLGRLWSATALTLGFVAGYLAYGVVHHATHRWRSGNRWSKERKRWHALHHRNTTQGCCYGVTSGFWDRAFGSVPCDLATERFRRGALSAAENARHRTDTSVQDAPARNPTNRFEARS